MSYADNKSDRVLEQLPNEYKVAHTLFTDVEMITDERQWEEHIDWIGKFDGIEYRVDFKDTRSYVNKDVLLVEVSRWRNQKDTLIFDGAVFGSHTMILQNYEDKYVGYCSKRIQALLEIYKEREQPLINSFGIQTPYTGNTVTRKDDDKVAFVFYLSIKDLKIIKTWKK